MYPLEKKAPVLKPLPQAYLHPMVCVVDVIEDVIGFAEPQRKFAPVKNDADFGEKSTSFLKRCYGEPRQISEILPGGLREVKRQ